MTTGRDALVAGATLAAGAVHVGIGVRSFGPEVRRMASRGWWDTVTPADPPAMAALWFTSGGLALCGLGAVGLGAIRQSGRLPREFGGALLAGAAPVCLLQPRSGAWLLLPLAVAALTSPGAARHGGAT